MVHMDSISEELISQGDNFAASATLHQATTNTTTTNTNSTATAIDATFDHSSIDTSIDTNHHHNIILYPFAHQVGGHTQLLTLDKGTLCKPLIPRELLFYLNVPKELVKFVPAYKGVVQIRETGPGNYPPLVYQPLRSPKSPYAIGNSGKAITTTTTNNNTATTNNYKHHHHHHHRHHYQHNNHASDNSQSVTDLLGVGCGGAGGCGCGGQHCSSPLELKVQIRPCSDEKILKKNLSQDNLLRADYSSRPNEKYLLLLENVASKYQLPCILDLKMGTRQHGDDATEEKRHRQIAKCQASTSASLGVRLCGMQVYQVDYGGFLWYDKYYGRKMDETGLKRALHQYFRNGSQLNEDIIDDVIDRLKLLSKAVEKSPSFRFYGTSLLIIHEGCTSRSATTTTTNTTTTTATATTKRCPVDVRLIDFAHTICDYTNTSGRSSSSPSVLKSSSAEQLTVNQQPKHQPHQPTTNMRLDNDNAACRLSELLSNANDDVEHDDSENFRPKQQRPKQPQPPHQAIQSPPPSPPMQTQQPPPHLELSSTIITTTTTKHSMQQSLTVAATPPPPAPPSSPRGEQEDENHHHHHKQFSLGIKRGVEDEEEEVEEDHGVVVSDDQEESESDIENNNNDAAVATNLSGSTIANALRKVICKQDSSSVESLCELDITSSVSSTTAKSNNNNNSIIMKPSGQLSSNNNNNENVATVASPATTIITTKQINSTPTTPPSIGSRKISKTSIGPDNGLLFGLENLMRLLVDLKSETLITC